MCKQFQGETLSKVFSTNLCLVFFLVFSRLSEVDRTNMFTKYLEFLPRDVRRAKRGIAIESRPSVRLSLRLSVTLRCPRTHNIGNLPQSSPRGTPPKFGWNRSGVTLLSRKPAISLKRCKIEPMLLLTTNTR